MQLAFHLKKNQPVLKWCTILSMSVTISVLKKRQVLKEGADPPGSATDQYFDLSEHVKMTCKIVFFRICGIAEIRRYLSHDTAKTIVHAYITSRLDYCNTLYCGLPKYLIDRLQIQQLALLPRRESIIILHRFLGIYTGFLCAVELFLKYCYCLITL